MPPKNQKKSDDDFSDLAVLPKAHIFKFSLVFESFFNESNRAKVTAKVNESLVSCSGDKVKTLSREEITAFGKGKNQLPDKNAQAAMPEENPLKNLSTEELFARAASDKLFEMTVLVRRSKKDKITKLEEEAAAAKVAGASEDEQQRLENLAIMAAEDFDLDALFYLSDYPQTQEEALAFAKYSHALNGVFQVNEVQKPVTAADEESEENEEEEEELVSRRDDDQVVHKEEAQQEEGKEEGDLAEEKEKATSIIQQLTASRSLSTAASPLRQMAFLKVPFVDEAVVEEEVNADTHETVEKRQASEDVFLADLITAHLDKYGQFFVQYLKFREIVTVDPLMPDKKALSELQCLKDEELVYQDQKTDLDAQYDEMQAEFMKEKDNYEGEELEQVEKEFEQQTQQIEAEQKRLADTADTRREQIKTLTVRKKVSIDEERNFDKFSIDTYQKDFVDNHETANKISSVLSAMITQIESHPEQRDGMPCRATSMAADSTVENENLDDMFEHFGREISCDLKLSERDNDASPAENPSIQLQNRYNKDLKLHEESDRTLEVQQSLPLKLIEDEGARVEQISQREHEVLSNLNLPGKNRYLMPTIPAKSKRARDSENPQFYPFCTLSHDEAERVLMLRAMQQLVRSNFIDNQQRGEQKHHKFKVFERAFENHMKPQIFKQVFAEALLDEPDMASMYYQRTDSLIVALYHKAKAEGAPDVQTPMGDSLDGERNWRAAYRVVPDFQNWLTFFSDELVFEQEPVSFQKKEENLASSQPQPDTTGNRTVGGFMKYQMDEDAMPEKMLDIEDDKVQSISERSGLLYPDDNSIMRVDNFTLGGKTFTKSIVCKDNFRFGLRAKSNQNQMRSEFYGLVSYKFVGDTEFWLQFENGTRLGIEQIQLCRNDQKTIRIDPPTPTPEEIAAKIELKKQYDIAVQKSQRSGGKIPVDIVIPKTPEPTWESEALNHLDELFGEDVIECNTALATLTLNNGLYIQYMGNGYVSQTCFGAENGQGRAEVNRICTKYGAIIRQFANRDAEVLYPDGEVAHFCKDDMSWTIINNKGKRRHFKDGVMCDIEPIPCACETDPASHATMMIREDDVVTVRYADRGYFCQHKDGTQMFTSPDGGEIRIEKPGFASHKLRIVCAEDYAGDKGGKVGSLEKVEERSVDGRIVETYLPDGSMSQTFLDNVATEDGGVEQRYRHIIKRADLSVVVIDSSGNISLISSNTRAALCEAGSKTKVDHSDVDKDYLAELARPHGSFVAGVYQALISSEADVSRIQTKNCRDDTVFVLKNDNTLTKFDLKGAVEVKDQKKPDTSKKSAKPSNIIGDMELEETGGHKNPLTRQYQYPRFFVIQGDGSARELISNDQLAYAMRKKKVQADQSIKQKMTDVHNSATVENHYFLTKVVNMKETEIEHQKLRDLEFPQNAQNALEKKEANKQREEIALQLPRQEQYLFTQIFEMPDMEKFTQEAFANDYQRYQEWRTKQVRFNTEFGIVRRKHGAGNPKDKNVDASRSLDSEEIEDDEFYSKRIALKILRFRSKPRKDIEAEEFKHASIKDMGKSSQVASFRQKCQATHSSLVSRGSDRPSSKAANGARAISSSHSQKSNVQTKEALDKKQLEQDSDLAEDEDLQKEAEDDVEVMKADKSKRRREYYNEQIQCMHGKKNTPSFEPHYFNSETGQTFLEMYPPKDLSPEVVMRMNQRIKRAQQEKEGGPSELQPSQMEGEMEGVRDDKDNPIVSLEPEDNLKKGSAFLGSKKNGSSVSQHQSSTSAQKAAGNETFIDPSQVPSLYTQERMYINQREKEDLLRSEEHHIVKTKEFNVYGRLRDDKPTVKVIQKTKAESELNEKFITTECITDRRVKISSMANRHYAQAPSVENVRKQGQHQMILGAITKKQTFAELINQANSMVTGVLHDPLKRSLNVMPSQACFGGVRAGTHNEIIITLLNEDSIGHRITIKPVSDKRIAIQQHEHGVIAPGMIRKISVLVRLAEDEQEDSIKDVLQIVTKHETFKIPITATIHLFENFEEVNKKHMEDMGKSVQNSRVRERLLRKIDEGREASRQASRAELLTKKPDDSEDKMDSATDKE